MTNHHAQRLEQLATAARETREKVTAQLAALRADTDHSQEWKLDREREIRDGFQKVARELATQRRDVLDRALTDLPADKRSADQILIEDGRISRRWSDLRADLDNGAKWQQLAAMAVDADDTVTLNALFDELPRYLAAQVPADRPGRREDVQQVMRNVTASLDQVIAEHGDEGHRKSAATQRLEVIRADAVASLEVGAVADAAAGRFDSMAFGVAIHYAKQAQTGDPLAQGANLADAIQGQGD